MGLFTDSTAEPEELVLRAPADEIRAPRNAFLPAIAGVAALIVAVGMTNLYSSSYGTEFFVQQCKSLGVGVFAFLFFAVVFPLKRVHSLVWVGYVIVVAMLIAVLVMGHRSWGAQRWIAIGPLRFQPSELVKLALVFVVARFFSMHKLPNPYRLRDLWLLVGLVGFVFGLVFMQPDLGTAGLCLLIVCVQMAFIPIDRRSFLIVVVGAVVVVAVGWSVFLHDYQKLRVLNLFDPGYDPAGSGYNSLQSLVAVGSGRLMGKGFMQGSQTQLQFLPARHTDFAFSVFAEEHGFLGGTLLFILYGTLSYLALEVARRTKDTFKSLVAIGIAAMFFVSFAVNVAMVLGLFPVVGIPLPLFSFGGSALITNLAALGILVAISRDLYIRQQ